MKTHWDLNKMSSSKIRNVQCLKNEPPPLRVIDDTIRTNSVHLASPEDVLLSNIARVTELYCPYGERGLGALA